MFEIPFLVQPKGHVVMCQVGSEESGVFEIPEYGYLTVGEKSFLQQAESSADTTNKVLSLAHKVSKSGKLNLDKALQVVTKVLSGQVDTAQEKAIAEAYSSELGEILTLVVQNEQVKPIYMAHCMLMYRLSADISMEYTMKLHPDIIKGLYELCQREQGLSDTRLEKAKDEIVTDEEANLKTKKR